MGTIIEDHWEKVYSTDQNYQANIVNMKLRDNGIESVVIKKKDSVFLVFGDIEVYTDQKDAEKARKIIEENNL